jgi:predicted anti-sigma-YlaC factor YlaD
MRVFNTHAWACERAREAASLRLDGELSQLETVLLERHLERCAGCAEFAASTAVLTRELRAAEPVALTHRIELPLRRRIDYGVRRAGAWVAAASVAATALLAVFALPSQRVERAGAARVSTIGNIDLREARVLRRAQMRPLALILSQPLRGPQLDS